MHRATRVFIAAATALLVSTLDACGGSDSGSSGGGASGATTSYSIGGSASGLGSGLSVVLQNNGGDNLTVSANSTFVFATKIASGSAYSVTVLTQPTGQTCAVTGGSGTASANVSGVAVACTTAGPTYSIGGNVSGLKPGLSVVLQDNAGDNLTVSSNTSFTFATHIATGGAFAVTVLTQPTGQNCVVSSGSGAVDSTNVSSIGVACTTSISGLTLSGGYQFVVYDGTLPNQISTFGLTTFATNGTYSASNEIDENGTIVNGSAFTGTYSFAANGQMTLGAPGGAATGAILGADDNVILLTNVASADAVISVGVKKGTGFTQSSAAGTYAIVGIGLFASPSNSTSDLAYVVLSSDGSTMETDTSNVAGTITGPATGHGSSLTVAGDGTFTGSGEIGVFSADGDMLVLQHNNPGGGPYVAYGVKQGSGVTAATLNGQYAAVGYKNGPDATYYTAIFDGKGNISVSSVDNNNGVITNDASSAGTYTVTSNGTLSVTMSGATTQGAVSADGNALVLAGVTSGVAPSIIVGVRQ